MLCRQAAVPRGMEGAAAACKQPSTAAAPSPSPPPRAPAVRQPRQRRAGQSPTADAVVQRVIRDKGEPSIPHDHLAFRTFGTKGLGIESLGGALEQFGFTKQARGPPRRRRWHCTLPARSLQGANASHGQPRRMMVARQQHASRHDTTHRQRCSLPPSPLPVAGVLRIPAQAALGHLVRAAWWRL